MKHMILFVMLVLIAGFASADGTSHHTIDLDSWIEFELPMLRNETADISVSVSQSNGTGTDVYVLSSAQYKRYITDQDFYPAVFSEKTVMFSMTYRAAADDLYYLVVDNRDNARPNDELPNGTISVNVSYLLRPLPPPDYYTDWLNRSLSISMDDYEFFAIPMKVNDTLVVRLKSPHHPVDVYFMASEVFERYVDSLDFMAKGAENVTLFSRVFVCPEDGIYYLVIDNLNNSHDGDASPESSVSLHLAYYLVPESMPREQKDEGGIGGMGAFSFAIFITIVAVLALFLGLRRGKKEEPPKEDMPPNIRIG